MVSPAFTKVKTVEKSQSLCIHSKTKNDLIIKANGLNITKKGDIRNRSTENIIYGKINEKLQKFDPYISQKDVRQLRSYKGSIFDVVIKKQPKINSLLWLLFDQIKPEPKKDNTRKSVSLRRRVTMKRQTVNFGFMQNNLKDYKRSSMVNNNN